MNRRDFLYLGAVAGLAGLGRGPSLADLAAATAGPAAGGETERFTLVLRDFRARGWV